MDNGTLCPADEPDFVTAAVRAGFLKILYPFTVKNGMYWRQENTATVENL